MRHYGVEITNPSGELREQCMLEVAKASELATRLIELSSRIRPTSLAMVETLIDLALLAWGKDDEKLRAATDKGWAVAVYEVKEHVA